ncbi:13518_t:CDS:2, partial [Gigaspora margarita]
QLDLLNVLSEHINNQKTLFNMIMISHNCARIFIPILWNDPFSSLFDCNRSQFNIEYKHVYLIETLSQTKTIFDYKHMIRNVNIGVIYHLCEKFKYYKYEEILTDLFKSIIRLDKLIYTSCGLNISKGVMKLIKNKTEYNTKIMIFSLNVAYCGTILHYLKGLKGESLVLCKGSLIDIKMIDCDHYSKNSMIEVCNLNTQLTLVEYDLMNYRKKILESIGKKNKLNVIIHTPCSENLRVRRNVDWIKKLPKNIYLICSKLSENEIRHYDSISDKRYYCDILVVCAFGKTISKLASEIGYKCAIELSYVHDITPSVWISALKEYLNNVLKETGNNFKTRLHIKKPDELFRLYCEKILVNFYHLVDIHSKIDRKIRERKFIIYQISSIFKFYETTFFILEFDWIKSRSHCSKIMKSETNSGIVKVDAKAIRNSDRLEIWHMEVAGSRMTLYSLNILSDRRFLLVELATASIPFSFHGRYQYKAVLQIMAIFHNEIMKQKELLGEINKSIIQSEKTTVRDILKIPEEIFEK